MAAFPADRSADFLDVANHPKMMFAGRFTERTGNTTFKGQGQGVALANERSPSAAQIDSRGFAKAVARLLTQLSGGGTVLWLRVI